jgi:CubicO group peptidase (beta-lactamase class C family)
VFTNFTARTVRASIMVMIVLALIAGCGKAEPTATPVPPTLRVEPTQPSGSTELKVSPQARDEAATQTPSSPPPQAEPTRPSSPTEPTPGENDLYLGQTPPGLDVQVFAPGIVSIEEGKEYKITFSPDLKEIFFTRRTPGGRDDRLWYSRLENGKLTTPELAPFSYDALESDACFTPDGKRLYFNSWRPLPGQEALSEQHNVWFVDKTEGGWSEPQLFDSPLNDYRPVYFSIADSGTMYFTCSSPREICYAELQEGQYREVKSLPDEINSLRDVAHPAIAPDEGYIVVDSSYQQGGRLVGSLYASFKKSDGSWTKAVSLGEVLKASESDVYASPRITPDGKYLFFEDYVKETDQADIYWVSTEIIEALRPEETPAPTAPLFALEKSPQEFGEGTFQVGLGDLDGDGDLDAVFANPQRHNSEVWLNDGHGQFTDSGQELTQYGHGVGVADFDGDGDLDAFITCHYFVRPSRVYLNDGSGNLQDTGQDLGDADMSGADLNLLDLDGDGDVDVHVMYYDPQGLPDKVYLNDGRGVFSDSGLALDEEVIAWGDLDADGDVDYLGKRHGQGYVVWLNDGRGQFAEGWQLEDAQVMEGGIALGDFDGDGDLDALVANGFRSGGSHPTILLWNDGSGQFTDSGFQFNPTQGAELALGDLTCPGGQCQGDGDGDLDVFVSNFDLPNEVWLNDGSGHFSDSGLRLGTDGHTSTRASLGDLDGDGDLDVCVGSLTARPEIWFNADDFNPVWQPLPSATPAPPTTPQPPFVADIRAYVEDLAAQEQFSGVVLIAAHGEPIFKGAYGLARRSPDVPNQIDTKFNLGSMDKMFTAVAVLQLVEQGQLALPDRIVDILPDYANRQVAEQVTVHQLLMHTSGLGNYFDSELYEDVHDQIRSVADYVPLFMDTPLLFEPGTRFGYSNSGFIVLGLIIEAVAGQDYYDYVREHIFEPAGMVNTAAYELDAGTPNLAFGYTWLDAEGNETDVLTDNLFVMPMRGGSAGGGFSTAEDLLRFGNALLDHQLLSPASTELLLEGKIELGEGVQYAYGFFDRLLKHKRVVGHGGGFPGICSSMGLHLDTGYTLIVLSNSDGDCAPVLEFAQERLLEQ